MWRRLFIQYLVRFWGKWEFVGIKPLKIRHDVTNLNLFVSLLFFGVLILI